MNKMNMPTDTADLDPSRPAERVELCRRGLRALNQAECAVRHPALDDLRTVLARLAEFEDTEGMEMGE